MTRFWDFFDGKGRLLNLSLIRFVFCLGIAANLFFTQFNFDAAQSLLQCEPHHFYALVYAWFFPPGSLLKLTVCVLALAAFRGGRLLMTLSTLLMLTMTAASFSCEIGWDPIYVSWNRSIIIFNLFVLACAKDIGRLHFFNLKKFSRSNLQRLYSETTDIWPENLLKFNLIFTYFAAAISKLRNGFIWVNGYSLQKIFFYRYINFGSQLSLWAARSFYFCIVISICILLMEFFSPAVFFLNKRLSLIYVVFIFCFQIGVYFIMDLPWIRNSGWAFVAFFIPFLTASLFQKTKS